jgi:hypothetical protein
MVRTALLGLTLVAFGAIASGAAPDSVPPDLAGIYRCNGVNPDGTAYEGVVEIAKLDGTYRVVWALSDNSSVTGVGIFSGGVLAVSYFGGAPAVVVYEVDGSRRPHGAKAGSLTRGGSAGSATPSRIATTRPYSRAAISW